MPPGEKPLTLTKEGLAGLPVRVETPHVSPVLSGGSIYCRLVSRKLGTYKGFRASYWLLAGSNPRAGSFFRIHLPTYPEGS